MTKKQIDICEKLYEIAKKQFYEGKISRQEYLETLFFVKMKIKELKVGFNELDFICKSVSDRPILEINIKETVNFVLAMN
ncbi:hypothetical protein ACNFU2_06650 [Chryseobacterium sp. PTM-20240506]|uniref:hypothetical protein n=1 Tax=Chryseobacterium sp. PTM-20240506 TaxID=3400631 RepID=UPI003AAD23A4